VLLVLGRPEQQAALPLPLLLLLPSFAPCWEGHLPPGGGPTSGSGAPAPAMAAKQNNVRVVCRFRPPNQRERELLGTEADASSASSGLEIMTAHNSVRFTSQDYGSKALNFTFDAVFDSTSTQEGVYGMAAQPAVAKLFDGFNATIFAYGQTGAGKTWTMMGSPEQPGVIPRAISQIFERINQPGNEDTYVMTASYVEIYNEQVRDLLNPGEGGSNLKVRETKGQGVYLEGVTELPITTEENFFEMLRSGDGSRAVSATHMNAGSSRSHAA
jgi:hypothetical protein